VGNPFVTVSNSNTVTEVDRGQSPPLVFGNALLGSTHSVPLRISNTGNQMLVVDATFDNSSYRIAGMNPSNCLAAIEPARTCALEIAFTPQQAGNQNSILHLQTNALNSPNVSLTGTGVANALVFSPLPGIFTTSPKVSITDSQSGSTIYYTTDGTMPTTASTRYTGPISVTVTERLTAIGVATGKPEAFGTAAYTIASTSYGNFINFGQGFQQASQSVQFNGSVKLDGSSLQLTDGGLFEVGSAFTDNPVNVQSFTTYFTFQLTDALADGFTFTIQDRGTAELGRYGSGLGYEGIDTSLAFKFDLHNNDGEGPDSVGLYLVGAPPTIPAFDLTGTGIDLHSGDPMQAQITYDGSTLYFSLTDAITSATWVNSFAIDIPQLVDPDFGYAWVGFTAGTGALSANQKILSWVYTSGAPAPPPPSTFGPPAAPDSIGPRHTNNQRFSGLGKSTNGNGTSDADLLLQGIGTK
jgi:Legume lectin domain/Chitobiase/beta-hexosaminidase C-terminal domain/Abnormal spindle-like microcephaly-assoc'd, ASPM-SPD-2-Hydin